MGSKDENGSFGEFIEGFKLAGIRGDVFGITYESPSLGTIRTGWSRQLMIGEVEIRTDYQMRYDNPWCQCKRAAYEMEITDGKRILSLNFVKNERQLK
jgi:hypothetical protein